MLWLSIRLSLSGGHVVIPQGLPDCVDRDSRCSFINWRANLAQRNCWTIDYTMEAGSVLFPAFVSDLARFPVCK